MPRAPKARLKRYKAPNPRVQRAKHYARSAYGNVTSSSASRGKRGEGGRYGSVPGMSDEHELKALTGMTYGIVGGATGAALTPQAREVSRKQMHSAKLDRQIANNKRKLKQQGVSKRRYRITDVGTAANSRWPQKGRILGATAAGGALGGGIVYSEAKGFDRHYKKKIEQQKKTIAGQKGKLNMNVNKSSMSAFGVDHGAEISKAESKKKNPYGKHGAPSVGRRVAAGFFGPFHGAVAGKQGKKLAASGSNLGHAVGGGAAGTLAGAALSRGNPSSIRAGHFLGSQAGIQQSVNASQRKGRFKPEYKG